MFSIINGVTAGISFQLRFLWAHEKLSPLTVCAGNTFYRTNISLPTSSKVGLDRRNLQLDENN